MCRLTKKVRVRYTVRGALSHGWLCYGSRIITSAAAATATTIATAPSSSPSSILLCPFRSGWFRVHRSRLRRVSKVSLGGSILWSRRRSWGVLRCSSTGATGSRRRTLACPSSPPQNLLSVVDSPVIRTRVSIEQVVLAERADPLLGRVAQHRWRWRRSARLLLPSRRYVCRQEPHGQRAEQVLHVLQSTLR